jgi:hypothetical protein
MRELKAKDIAPFTKILSKIGAKDILSEVLKERESENLNGRELIASLIGSVIENYYKAEDDFLTFISNLDGRTKEEISDLPIGEFISLINEAIPKDLGFFKSAASTQRK